METFIFSEVFKRISNLGLEPQMYFWRTSVGAEVDLLIEDQGKLIPLEIKATSTPRPQMAEGILSFRQDVGAKAADGYVVHLGDLQLPLAEHVTALPFTSL